MGSTPKIRIIPGLQQESNIERQRHLDVVVVFQHPMSLRSCWAGFSFYAHCGLGCIWISATDVSLLESGFDLPHARSVMTSIRHRFGDLGLSRVAHELIFTGLVNGDEAFLSNIQRRSRFPPCRVFAEQVPEFGNGASCPSGFQPEGDAGGPSLRDDLQMLRRQDRVFF
jgi:hypothetical protein